MKKIPLKNYINESLIVAIGSFLLAIILFYLGILGTIELRISGANLDADTSKILIFMIALAPSVVGVNSIIKFISIKKYGAFEIILHTNKIEYPTNQFMKGFKKKEINRELIYNVKIINVDRNKEHIYLLDQNGMLKGYIDSVILPHKMLNSEMLKLEISKWLVN